jgi:predicted ATPase
LKIRSIDSSDVLPVRRFEAAELADVVVIAGPNGVGKSRLIDGLLQKFQNPHAYPNVRIVIESTSPSESAAWGKELLDTSRQEDSQILSQTLQQNRSRREWNSSVVHFESDRSIQQITPFQFSWDINDPWVENIGWNQTFNGLRARFQDTLHSLFRKMQSHEKDIARRAIELQRTGNAAMALDFADPLKAFKDAFSLLLAPKRLLDPDPRNQQLFYEHDGDRRPLSSLSSGEREVVNIVFDFILRTASDCIVFFDEPELHLHPELSYKLLQALRTTGNRNQFIFCTHSPEIITASLDQTVVFLSPPRADGATARNQAVMVREDDSTNQALRLLGQSIGVVSLGRRLVLIEGSNSSLDKQTYGLMLKNRFPTLVLVPTGGRDLIRSFGQIVRDVLDQAIWGVDFFMLCDRDAADGAEIETLEEGANGRLRFLKRYHLENYFLDAAVISSMFADLEAEGSWLRDPCEIENRLRGIAKNMIGYAVALIVSARIRRRVGNVDVMVKASHEMSCDQLMNAIRSRTEMEFERVQDALEARWVEANIRETFQFISSLLDEPTDAWKIHIPGRPVLSQFAALSNLSLIRFKTLYLAAAERASSSPFADIVQTFASFSTA